MILFFRSDKCKIDQNVLRLMAKLVVTCFIIALFLCSKIQYLTTNLGTFGYMIASHSLVCIPPHSIKNELKITDIMAQIEVLK